MSTTKTNENHRPPLAYAADSAALARKAFQHGQLVARKANDGLGYDRPWDDVPEPTKKAFLAMTRFIIRSVKPNAQAQTPPT